LGVRSYGPKRWGQATDPLRFSSDLLPRVMPHTARDSCDNGVYPGGQRSQSVNSSECFDRVDFLRYGPKTPHSRKFCPRESAVNMGPEPAVAGRKGMSAVVLSWPGYIEEALLIQKALAHAVDDVEVLHNSISGTVLPNPHWTDLGPDAFFGKKFSYGISNSSHEILLFIVADARCEDWTDLAKRCREVFSLGKNVGVWAPTCEGTPWRGNRTALRAVRGVEGLMVSTVVDSIVWAIRSDLISELRDFDYPSNKFGWGIETAVACLAHSSGIKVVVDSQSTVHHPQGPSYDSRIAERQGHRFTEGLPTKLRFLAHGAKRILYLEKRKEVVQKQLFLSFRRLFWTVIFFLASSKGAFLKCPRAPHLPPSREANQSRRLRLWRRRGTVLLIHQRPGFKKEV